MRKTKRNTEKGGSRSRSDRSALLKTCVIIGWIVYVKRRVFTSNRCATRRITLREKKNSVLTDSRIIKPYYIISGGKKIESKCRVYLLERKIRFTERARSNVITRIIVKLNAVESRCIVRERPYNHRFSYLKSMTNLVHAHHRLPCHVTMAEKAKMWSLNVMA